jgi:glycosyltransferase involved in cell wall biosynthesis
MGFSDSATLATMNAVQNSPSYHDAEPLNIVIVNDFAHVNGGAAQVAISSAIGLSSRGHKVTFFAAVPPIADELKKTRISMVLTDQFDIKNDPNRFRAATQGIWNSHAAAKMKVHLAGLDRRRTVLHVHGWTKSLTSSVIHAAIRQRFPVAITLHDYFMACPNGGFFNFPKNEICHLHPLSISCLKENCDRDGYGEKLWRSTRQVVQNNFGLRDSPLLSFVTISAFSEEILKPFLPSSSAVFRVASPSDFEKGDAVDVTRNQSFVSLGRLSPEKGLPLLAKACRELDCPVTFIGDGPSRNEILAIDPNAHITGWQSREEVKSHLRSARCLVLPSLWYEAQPMVVAEAAAIGVPAIVSDQCAGSEMVENGVTGLWFRSGDWLDLKSKMAQLQDPEVALKMGSAAYSRHWNDPFTLQKHLDSLELCYRSILERVSVQSIPGSVLEQ